MMGYKEDLRREIMRSPSEAGRNHELTLELITQVKRVADNIEAIITINKSTKGEK